MNNILVINLKRFGDIFMMGNTLASLQKKYPSANISVITFDEFKRGAKILSNVSSIHTINRKRLLTIANNRIFSDGIALNLISENLLEVENTKWDLVVNYSNDKISTYLTSVISKRCHYKGVKFNNKHIVEYSNDWALIFNDILTADFNSPFHFVDAYQKIIGGEHVQGKDLVKTNPEHNETAFKNLNKIRAKESVNGKEPKLIGIQIYTSDESKSLDEYEVCALIERLLDNPNYYPMLLCAPFENERKVANSINENFENKLITIESDFLALPSVLLNLDAIITPDTSIKHMADLLDTPMVEISKGLSPYKKQGSISPGNFIIRATEETRFEEISEVSEYCLDNIFNHKGTTIPTVETCIVKRVTRDQYGVMFEPVFGDIQNVDYFRYLASRELIGGFLINPSAKSELIYKKEFSNLKERTKFILNEKQEIADITRALLSSLRSNLQLQDGIKAGAENFLKSFDSLLAFCERKSLGQIPVLYFRAKVETLPNLSKTENIKAIEHHLYNLKAHLKGVISVLDSIQGIEAIVTKPMQEATL